MSNENASIITDTKYIYGLGVISTAYNPVDENIYEIRFIDHFKWILFHNNIPLMNVKYTFPSLPLNMIQQVTAIDGALLIDMKGICYAAGLILDGLATDKGDSARGA